MNTFLGVLVITVIALGWVALFLRGTRWDVVDAVHRRRGPDTPQPEPAREDVEHAHPSDALRGPAESLLPRHPQLPHVARHPHVNRQPHVAR